jgi:hypothetical protein
VAPPDKSVVLRRGYLLHSDRSPISKETAMRQSLMSIQREVSIDLEDMRLNADVEPWNPGACRRR